MADALATYLNDHLAGSNFAISLLERMASNQDDDVRTFAEELLVEERKDQDALKGLIERVGGKESVVKGALGWISDWAASVKLRMHDESLGLFESLEMLGLGVLGKLSLWRALAVVADTHPAVREFDLEYLAKRAEAQHADIERERLAAAMKALR
jgi:hypothetical protein